MASAETTDSILIKGAPLWRRFAALVYDSFIILALSFGYGAIMTAVAAFSNSQSSDEYQPMFSSPLFGLGWAAVIVGFYWIFWYRFGQTTGMKTWHLKLVSIKQPNELSKVSWTQCLQRSALGLIAFFGLGFGYVFKLYSRTGDCWHDKLSGTRVIVTKPLKK